MLAGGHPGGVLSAGHLWSPSGRLAESAGGIQERRKVRWKPAALLQCGLDVVESLPLLSVGKAVTKSAQAEGRAW